MGRLVSFRGPLALQFGLMDSFQTVSVGNWVNKRIGIDPTLGSVPTRRRSGGGEGVLEGRSESPTSSTGARLLSAVSQVNAREEHDRAQDFCDAKALPEDDDA
jgi:hypothetical protein